MPKQIQSSNAKYYDLKARLSFELWALTFGFEFVVKPYFSFIVKEPSQSGGGGLDLRPVIRSM